MIDRTARELPTAVRPRRADEQLTAQALADAIEVLAAKADGKRTIDIKVRATEALFRIAPARDPHQPRLWCASVRQCSAGGLVDMSGPTWIDRPGRTWAELAAVVETIRSDVGSWLATPARRDLCRWLLNAAPLPTAAEAAGIPGSLVAPRRAH